MKDKINFRAGRNIAMKVPSHLYDRTLSFYRDIVCLPQLESKAQGVVFEFGDKKLWIDNEPHMSQAEIWLEIECDDINAAQAYFDRHKVTRRDKIETLPDDFRGFWISNPADIIHLVSEQGQD